MKYGVIVTTGDPRTVAELATEAEEAGWDGVFYWDAVAAQPGGATTGAVRALRLSAGSTDG